MKNYRIEAVILAVAIIIVGFCLSSGLKYLTNGSRSVTVKGLAEMEVKADKITWPVVYKELSNDLVSLHSSLNRKNEKVVKFLTDKGLSKDDISVAPPTIVDLLAERYNSQPVVDRYNATSVIIVTSNNVDLVREIMDQQSELLTQGIAINREDYSYRVNYNFTGLNDIKPKMIESATANAREAAEKFAADSDSKLGKIKNATQGQFSISDRDAYTPYLKSVRVVTTIEYFLED